MRRNSSSPRTKTESSSKIDKLYNPSAQFSEPTDIMHDEGLSKEEKKKLSSYLQKNLTISFLLVALKLAKSL